MNRSGNSLDLILIVDDDPTARTLLKRILEKDGLAVAVAERGEDAVEMAGRLLPLVMLVDAMMPGMDGFEVCRRIKASELTADIPVLMVTALGDISDIERGFDAGAMDYIRKPFNPRELLIRTRNACILRKSQLEQQRWREQLTRELCLAERLQKRLLDSAPIVDRRYLFNSNYIPSLGVSGDVFDRFVLADGRLCFYMADVCGHGVAASLVSSLIKAIASEVILSGSWTEPCTICNEIDHKLKSMLQDDKIYASAFLGVYDPCEGLLRGMCCGHPSPIHLKSGGGYLLPFTARGGLPLGFLLAGDVDYSQDDQVDMHLGHGDTLIVYTDGLSEARHDESGEDCGIEGLAELLQDRMSDGDRRSFRSAEMIPACLRDAGYDIEKDDCSVMVLQAFADLDHVRDLFFKTDFDAVANVGICVEEDLVSCGWSEEDAGRVRLLLVEYCNNLVEHSHIQGAGSRMGAVLWTHADGCTMRISDAGPHLDFMKMVENAVMPEGLEDSGRGLAIIRSIADSFAYFRAGGENFAFFTVKHNSAAGSNASA